METLDGTEWDVVISGSGLVPSLLALALSRSGKRILHLDCNDYYGGTEAALSLAEAETWTSQRSSEDDNAIFSHATITQPEVEGGKEKSKLSPSRAYSLALAPQLIYARSTLIDALVSSRAHNQLDFQAVGSWFVVERSASQATLKRVPSGREDIFQDTSLDLKAKRALMKFLRFVGTYEDQPDVWHDRRDQAFSTFLAEKFALPPASHELILALTLTSEGRASTTTEQALPSMAKYLRSIGVLGPGFGSVLPKWGGMAEIAQVCCRACAVGGGVYVLHKSIEEVEAKSGGGSIQLELANGEKVSTKWLCGTRDDLPVDTLHNKTDQSEAVLLSKSISIISSPLPSLFPPTSEGGVTPAGAVVVVPGANEREAPVHLFVHTAEAGECPMTQSVIYASTALPHESGFPHLERAVIALLESVGEQPVPEVPWTLKYQQQGSKSLQSIVVQDGVITLPGLSQNLAVDDSVMDEVRSAWSKIIGEDQEAFLQFDARDGLEDDS